MNCGVASTTPTALPRDVDQRTINLNVASNPSDSKVVAAEEQRREIAHESNERGLTDYTRILAGATIGLIVIAVAQALLFLWQLRYMRVGLEDARRSADAARDSAIAASQSVEIAKSAMVAGNRAFVHYYGCIWRSHTLDSDNRVFWRFSVRWMNAGNTPTRRLRSFVKHEFLDAPMDPSYQFSAAIPTHTTTVIAAKGEVFTYVVDLFGDELLLVKQQKKRLYIWGVAQYSDVFPESKEYITHFCVEARNLTGDPATPWDDEKNRFDIQFAHYDRHNCMDEDCS